MFSQACVKNSVHRVCLSGVCVHGSGCASQRGMHGFGVRGRGGMSCGVGGGHVWWAGGCMHERLPLQRMVRILLECILVIRYCQSAHSECKFY